MKKFYITQEGLEKLKKELEHLEKVTRKEVSLRIKKALEEGDISESGEYSEAKEQQAFTEGKIAEISNKIKHAEIIKNNGDKSKVELGSTIRVKCNDNEMTYTMVGSSEADPSQGRISNESPIGKAFIGKQLGEKLKVETPAGEMDCEVLGIE